MFEKISQAISDANERALEKETKKKMEAQKELLRQIILSVQFGLYTVLSKMTIGFGVKPVVYVNDVHPYPTSACFIMVDGVSFAQCDFGILADPEKRYNNPAQLKIRDRIFNALDIERRRLNDQLNAMPPEIALPIYAENPTLSNGLFALDVRQIDDELVIRAITPVSSPFNG